MIQLLYTVSFVEMTLILTLLFETPLRKLVIMALDKIKQGRGPIMVKTVAGTVFVLLLSSVYSIVNIQNSSIDPGAINPTDQVLMATHMLEASLMGFFLFLCLMVDRLHHYIRELRLLRKTMEAAKKQNRVYEDGKGSNAQELKTLGAEIAELKTKMNELESECERKAKEAKASEAEAEALRKQSEGFLMEYARLQADNQNLRNQLQCIDQSLSFSDSRKDM